MYQSNYDKEPYVQVPGCENQAFAGYSSITQEILKKIHTLRQAAAIVTIECYPGVRKEEVLPPLTEALSPCLIIDADDYSLDGEAITQRVQRELTDDRVFGMMSIRNLEEFFDHKKISEAQNNIAAISHGIVLLYGTGASLIHKGHILIYADLARWEIQQRYRRAQLGNWKLDNYEEDTLKKYKRGFFLEWPMADRLKKSLYPDMDYILDTNQSNNPKMVTKQGLDAGLRETVSRPFRVVPYFDPGVWGGHWMQEVCDLDREKPNFAWCFDCVPEENSLYLKYGTILVEIPSIDVVFFYPRQLLGEKVHARFGTEFPIRFDFLDTMGGQNLSLQVHPLTEYIQETFGMHYTQDESYYILDAVGDAAVYLGVKENIQREAMLKDLKAANEGGEEFPDEKYINRFPAKKHDHFLIPAGTIHCSGRGCMVLEISATPYIFTFKLWDWNRLGLDGKPRPVHLSHGERVIQWDRDTKWVRENLVDQICPIEEGEGFREERTGLHEREFIETRRHWFREKVLHHTHGSVNVLNLVEGAEAVVESPDGSFAPFLVHYAETFIIPAQIGSYTIAPYGSSIGTELATIKAYVR